MKFTFKKIFNAVLFLLLILITGQLKAQSVGDIFTYTYQGQTLYYKITSLSPNYVSVTNPAGGTNPGYGATTSWAGHTEPSGALTIPTSVEYSSQTFTVNGIDNWAFHGCTGLTGDITVDIESIGQYAFKGCTGLGPNLTLGSSVNNIGLGCFIGCSNIMNIDLSAVDIYVSLGWYDFYQTGWDNNLDNGVAYLGNRCMVGHNVSGDVTIADGIQVICRGAFDSSPITSIHLPNSLLIIHKDAFALSELTEIKLPNSLEIIGDNAFEECLSLGGDLVIPSSVTYIGERAFSGGDEFLGHDLIINSSAVIGPGAFDNCRFGRIISTQQVPPTAGDLAFRSNYGAELIIPSGSQELYRNANEWSKFNYTDLPTFCMFVGGTTSSWLPYNASDPNTYETWVGGDYPDTDDDVIILADCNLEKDNVTINTINIAKGSTFTIKKSSSKDGANRKLTVGTIENHGDASSFVIEDGAQLINNTSGVLATVERDIRITSTAADYPIWHLISSPVKGETNPTDVENLLKGINGNNYGLYRFDQREEEEWRNYYNTQFNLINVSTSGSAMVEGYMYGYRYETPEDYNTLGFQGELQPGATQYVITLDVDENHTCVNNNSMTPFNGVNLIGNPFPYNLDSRNDITIDGTSFETYYGISYSDASGSEMKAYTTVYNHKDYKAIKPGMGFFVETARASAAPYSEKHKFKINCGGSKDSRKQYASISINAGNEDFTDAAFIQIEEGNILHKMTLSDKTAKVYVKNNNEDYAALTIEEATGVLPVCFEAPRLGRYTISVSANNLDLDYMHLIDNLTGEDIDMLLEKEYSFMASKDDNANRFMLVFRNNAAGDETGDDIFAYQNGSDIIVDGEGELQIFDVMGRMVKATAINGIETINMPENGVYIFRMEGKTQKIVVR